MVSRLSTEKPRPSRAVKSAESCSSSRSPYPARSCPCCSTSTIRRGKGGKARTLPLGRGLVRELETWINLRRTQARDGNGALLVNLGGRKAAGRRMSPRMLQLRFARHYLELDFPARYRGVHTLRHTAGTRFYRGLKDLYAVARLLGHSDVNTSAVYAKMDLEGLRAQVERLEENG